MRLALSLSPHYPRPEWLCYGSASEGCMPATHDISRVSYHVKHLENFVTTLQDSANRAFPNRGRPSQRYTNVQALLLHWKSDDLFVLPELEDLEKTLREEYHFETDIFAIPSENSHLELMLRVGELIKKHEGEDTLFLVYYGGHAKIDESRQSTWCATRRASSPWLQWSAIQTLLERSASDVLILLDCCAGAASATFPNGQSITETISASSWDAIAPDPGRYSFTNALIEVLTEWRIRSFSAAMLHAEILARLKHPRPILINGKQFEARSTPVHFMMTSNHKAPSIELSAIKLNGRRPITPPIDLPYQLPSSESSQAMVGRSTAELAPAPAHDAVVPQVSDPDINQPHVMISLALEDDQHLELNAWEQWLANFPALAKHVKIQGVFRSHSTLLLLSLPVMVWDLLPDDPAYSFVAFIRSNNLIRESPPAQQPSVVPDAAGVSQTPAVPQPPMPQRQPPQPPRGPTYPTDDMSERDSRDRESIGGSTMVETLALRPPGLRPIPSTDNFTHMEDAHPASQPYGMHGASPMAWAHPPGSSAGSRHDAGFDFNFSHLARQNTAPPALPRIGGSGPSPMESIARTMILNQSRSSKRTIITAEHVPEGPPLADHVVQRLEEYFQKEHEPNVAVTEFLASNFGVETDDIRLWFHHRREEEKCTHNLQQVKFDDIAPAMREGSRMILAGQLNNLLEIFPSKSVLLVDLRSSIDYEKSHIHDAINLRTPLSFVQAATLEMIQDTFVDNHSQRNFAKWYQSRCVVFYDRGVEYTWECPVADALLEKFKRQGWPGQFFILKGHFKEFSVSFDKYISGTRMTQQAKDYADSLRQQPTPTQEEAQRKHAAYDAWLHLFTSEDRVPPIELVPHKRVERMQAVEQHQRELEAEFETRFPALWRKAQALRPAEAPMSKAGAGSSDMGWMAAPSDDRWTPDNASDLKAGLVGHLDRGLDKMRQAGGFPSGYSTSPDPLPRPGKEAYTDKLGERVDRYSDDFDEIDPKGEGWKNDPAFQLAGAGSKQESTGETADEQRRKGRRPLWNRLRSTGNR
ncbi:hypothetical protein GQ53DRAFT_74197 [Thozetella sp. PMI_491]|nr:hypothetical protein GQ53DRAFT_74197 [Thozetella sp. PMI_491]